MTTFVYHQHVPIDFGAGKLQQLPMIIARLGYKKGLLITTKSLIKNGTAANILTQNNDTIVDVFYGIQPNPTVQNTEDCMRILREGAYDFAVALGGGSVLDCAKVAATLAPTSATMQSYFNEEFTITAQGLPLIAVPTTAGTASELTKVSVITDPVSARKVPFNNPFLYPTYALIDPLLTVSCNQHVTATSGIDVLAHALEALYNKHHQPFTDLFAKHAASLVFQYLQLAYDEPNNIEARTKMAEASVAAGLAFNITQTAAAHACSYPLTEQLNVPHGEACAFTLSKFWLLNANDPSASARLQTISEELGFLDAVHVAEEIERLKKGLGLRTSWQQLGVESAAQIKQIVDASFAPNMQNSFVTMTKESLFNFYKNM